MFGLAVPVVVIYLPFIVISYRQIGKIFALRSTPAIRGGAVSGGTETAPLPVSRNSHLLKVDNVTLIVKVVIFLAAMYFLGVL